MAASIVWATAAVAIAGLACFTLLRAWRGWLDLKRAELARHPGVVEPSPAARIEVADLRERLRRLEAIASGLDV